MILFLKAKFGIEKNDIVLSPTFALLHFLRPLPPLVPAIPIFEMRPLRRDVLCNNLHLPCHNCVMNDERMFPDT